VGFAVAALGPDGVLMGLVGLLAAELLLVAGLFGLAGEQLRATLHLSRRAVAGVRAT
jgi:hypothetical protein